MGFIFLAFVTTVALLVPSAAFAVPSDMQIYILAGQSNMSGRGKSPQTVDQVEGVWNFSNAWVWEHAKEPLDSAVGQIDLVSSDEHAAGVGPGLAFASRMRKLHPNKPIGLVQCAKGGTSMELWLLQGGRETLYGSCIARAREAAKHGQVAGILFYQGESDAQRESDARNWGLNFSTLIARFRYDLKSPKIPVVFAQIGKLSKRQSSASGYPYWEVVKASQSQVKISNTVMIRADRYDSPEGLHLSTKGYNSIGNEFARAMSSLVPR